MVHILPKTRKNDKITDFITVPAVSSMKDLLRIKVLEIIRIKQRQSQMWNDGENIDESLEVSLISLMYTKTCFENFVHMCACGSM